ncbi:uncharacterized protein [Dysidea avara]|uniref:uncharacterized protein n=1 Tax=Dysidea avara TaxID=196820 RepID=UPI00332BF257
MTELNLMYFVTFLYNEGFSADTVKSYLSAARYTQISLGFGDSSVAGMPKLELVIKGLKKRTATRQSHARLPVTPEILRALKKVWEDDANRKKAVMLWAAVCMCFFSFLHSGEVVVPTDSGYDKTVHLSYCDVRVDSTVNPQYLEVRIKVSKTDPFRKGVTVYLGRADGDRCPVSAVLAYMVQRGPDKGPFFWFTKDRFLTQEWLVTAMRAALGQAGLDSRKYAGHSFRIGAATTTARSSLLDSLIKTLGRWESAAYTVPKGDIMFSS